MALVDKPGAIVGLAKDLRLGPKVVWLPDERLLARGTLEVIFVECAAIRHNPRRAFVHRLFAIQADVHLGNAKTRREREIEQTRERERERRSEKGKR